MKDLKKIFFSTILSLLFLSCYSNDDWKTIIEKPEVKVESKNFICDYTNAYDQEFIFLRITNLTKQDAVISYTLKLWYDDKCISCENEETEFRKTFKLKPYQRIESDCHQNSKQSKIFVKFSMPLEKMPGVNKIVKLTKYEITNLTVTYD